MKVQTINTNDEPVVLLPGIESPEADFKEYTNKITGKLDPMLVYAPGRFVHMSTAVYIYHLRVQNIETGEIIEIDDLSPAGVKGV